MNTYRILWVEKGEVFLNNLYFKAENDEEAIRHYKTTYSPNSTGVIIVKDIAKKGANETDKDFIFLT